MSQNVAQMRRDSDYAEVTSILHKTHRCALLRPTGYGKTGILSRLVKDYKHVLYLYPNDANRQAVLRFHYGTNDIAGKTIPNVVFCSYAKLVRMTMADITNLKKQKFDLIVCDECQIMGAAQTGRQLDILFDMIPDADVVGATATPDRMDMIDEIARYFESNVASEYNYHNAFTDGVLQRPHYIYCQHADISDNGIANITTLIQSEIDKLDSERDRLIVREHLKAGILEAATIHNMPQVIKRNCDKFADSTDYMRFICFFSSFAAIHQNGSKVKEWFEKAYPGHTVNATIISTEKSEYSKNVHRIHTLNVNTNTIDLIFCCDMLNTSYHVDNLTGILMYRLTRSNSVFTQQLGRILSSGSSLAGIVFDVVDNIHQNANYLLVGRTSVYTTAARKRFNALQKRKLKHDQYLAYINGEIQPSQLTKKQLAEFQKMQQNDDEDTGWSKRDQSEYNGLLRRFAHNSYTPYMADIEPSDFIAVDEIAPYRDIIAKTVAECIAMRNRQAWARCMEERAVNGQITDKSGHVFTRAEVWSWEKDKINIPLGPFAYAKRTTINSVLDEMGIV